MASPVTTSRRGLANVGNTCYLNAALQALRHVGPVAEYFGTDAWTRHRHPERKGDALAEQTAALFRAFAERQDGTIVPSPFVKSFLLFARDTNDDIRYGAQADAAEALQILLDGLHTYVSREVRMTITGTAATPEHAEIIEGHKSWTTFFCKEYSLFVDLFYGQTQLKVFCKKCESQTSRYEPWSVLKAPIPGADKAGAPAPTLRDCLGAAFAEEAMEDYICDSCKTRGSAVLRHAISVFPRYLIVSLKRFTNTGAKVLARIPYDTERIDLCEWRAWPKHQGTSACQYRVMSTIEHHGGSGGGHYSMRARTAGDTWLHYDDSSVTATDGGACRMDTYVLILERIPLTK